MVGVRSRESRDSSHTREAGRWPVIWGAFGWKDEEGCDVVIPFFMMFGSVSKGWDKRMFHLEKIW
jgi:hypothetical protein